MHIDIWQLFINFYHSWLGHEKEDYYLEFEPKYALSFLQSTVSNAVFNKSEFIKLSLKLENPENLVKKFEKIFRLLLSSYFEVQANSDKNDLSLILTLIIKSTILFKISRILIGCAIDEENHKN